ncbi:hypothetical protein GCM10022279_09290 [Comamonas faecalis]|uniref:Protein kinase domain-containing protein n=1 Tax=Comamonas faecalis TaxID=1387849 RepID=A0ABP7QUM2_9BURK
MNARVPLHPQALPQGMRLGEFELTQLLGVGGFGMVYQAFDHALLRFVAIKEYMPVALAQRTAGHQVEARSGTDAQALQAGLDLFIGEARLLAQFDHPSLVKVLRFWQEHGTAYMVMPLYGGMTLRQARALMRTPPPEAWLRKILWSVTSALRVLHAHDTLHLDISPDNIFLQDRGPPVLLDLGAARQVLAPADGQPVALKLSYAPLEQFGQASPPQISQAGPLPRGPWSDLYALAAVVHGCVCNDAPLPATLRALRDRMPRFRRVARTVGQQFGVHYGAAFVRAIDQALAVQPQDRPQSIDAFVQAMDMAEAPAGWEQFDFRAELQGAWCPPGSDTAPAQQAAEVAAAAPEDDGGFATTLALPMDAGWPAEQTPPREPPRRPHAGHARAAGRRGPWRWVAAAAGVAVLATALAWMGWGQGGRVASPHLAVAAAGDPGLPVTGAPAPNAVVPDAGAGAGAGADVGVVVNAPAADAAIVQSPAAPAAARPAPRVRTRAPVRTASAVSAASASPAALAADAGADATPDSPQSAQSAADPLQACAGAGFIARPMCIHRQCQLPAFAQHAHCVDLRQKQQEQERQRLYLPP